MRVYIVRHGQSTSNALRNHLSGNAGLTSLGIRQSKKIARRLRVIPFEIIICSDYKRALQTAEIIRKFKQRKLLITKLLREEKHPSELTGVPANDPKAEKIKNLLRINYHRKRWHFSDEENFFDLKKRIGAFLNLLEKRKEKNILIIGHVFSTRMLIGLMLFGKDITPDIFQNMRDKFLSNNTGITLCLLNENGWKLITWNDYAHLAEVKTNAHSMI